MPLDRPRSFRPFGTLGVVLAWIVWPALVTAQQALTARQPQWEVLLPADEIGAAGAGAGTDDWVARIEHAHSDPEQAVVSVAHLTSALALATQTVERADVERLVAVEQHLLRARTHAAQLSESEALTELNHAEQVVQTLLHVSGAPTFYAEIETAIGLVAAQAGLDALAVAALRRAAVVDPMRGVRAAETTPVWVDKAAALAREIAAGPQGEIAITTNIAGAQVFIDDTLRGTAPLTLRTTRGVHVLRVEAPGHRPLGMLLPVDAGTRPNVHVELNRDRVDLALNNLARAARTHDAATTRDALQQLRREGAPIAAAWWLETSPVHPERALVTRCVVEGCEPTRRLELDLADASQQRFGQPLDPAGLGRDRHTRDQSWLRLVDDLASPSPRIVAAAPWWQRWYVWTAVAAVAGGATAWAIAASDAPETEGLRITVEP